MPECQCDVLSNLCALSTNAIIYYFFFNDTATTEIYTLSLHDALPICCCSRRSRPRFPRSRRKNSSSSPRRPRPSSRSEEHTSELQSLRHLVCRLLLEKKKQEQGASRPGAC